MMPPGLLTLLGLNLRARLRRLRRSFRGIKGIILLALFAFFAGSMILSWTMAGRAAVHRDMPPRTGPFLLFVFAAMSALGGLRTRGLYFPPAEIDLLFPAPLRRWHLVAYRLACQLLPVPITCLFLALYLTPHSGSFASAYIGSLLYFAFLAILGAVVSLAASGIGERLARFGWIAAIPLWILGLVLVMGFVIGPAKAAGLPKALLESGAARILLAPFDAFARVFAAARIWPDLLLWGAVAAGLDAALAGAVFLLDIDYREAALATSRRIHERLRSLRRGGYGMPALKRLRLRLPVPPRWGGVGPLAWRQAIEATRNAPAALLPVLLFAAVILPGLVRGRGGHIGILAAVALFAPQWLRFDFRGDAPRMEILKTFPIPGLAMAMGQVAVPALVLTILLAGGLGLTAILGEGPTQYFALVAIPFVPPASLLLLCVDNALFLLYPAGSRPVPGDVASIARNMLTMLLKFFVLAVVAGVAAGIGYAAYAVTGGSAAAGQSAAWLVCAAAAVGALAACAWAFARYDVSRETVPE